MKKQLFKPTFLLAAAVGTTLLTGCASMDRGYSEVNGANSALAFTTVTNPKELVKWSDNRQLLHSMRSMDTYYFQVRDTGSEAAGVALEQPVPPPTSDQTAVGGPAPYESATGGSKLIEYRPGYSD